MYKFLALILFLGVFLSTGANSEPPKSITGYVASFDEMIIGGEGKIDATKAKELYEAGKPLVFVIGKGKSAKAYFVYNESGTYMGKRLAMHAGKEVVTIKGAIKKVAGVNIIVAQEIES